MTKEEKQVLLKDLSARIPYQPLCKKIDTEDDFCECDGPLGYSLRDFVGNKVIIKPYLRPMSSMTEDEEREFEETLQYTQYTLESYDWLNTHHFDYRGLIPMGLALEAPEDMYKTEKIMIEEELTFDNHAGEFEAFLYSPSGHFLGVVRHEPSLLAFLCKVKESGSDGYYIVYEGKKYPIDKDGRTPSLPIHFIDDYLQVILGF